MDGGLDGNSHSIVARTISTTVYMTENYLNHVHVNILYQKISHNLDRLIQGCVLDRWLESSHVVQNNVLGWKPNLYENSPEYRIARTHEFNEIW